MTITTIYNQNQTVWFIHNNQIKSGEILQICHCTDTGTTYLILPTGEEQGISLPENLVYLTEGDAGNCTP